jgi:hypothetical protein
MDDAAPEQKETPMSEYQGFSQEPEGTEETGTEQVAETGTEEIGTPEATTAETTTTPAQPAKVTSKEMLEEKFPMGTLVEVSTKGSDYTKQQGEVTGYEEKRGAWYVGVDIKVNASGQRRAEAKGIVTRWQSLTKIDEYRPVPVSAQTAAAQEAVAATQGG